ncbi:MATE family efflux transporter [Breoghania sp. L-A4]|uniref:MATE family efflux transporter n=1 Tax=Breoghania sp. L-A4 TaxID=2304600 RepID=UPI0013C2FCA3|nr:MATE family efflux transporter [Breoghania sp. L-A4]
MSTDLNTPHTPGMPDAPAPLRYHITRTLFFALPIIVSRTALLVMFTIDTIMTGWSGGNELAYLGLGVAFQLTLMLIGIGALQATVVLIAQAVGAGRPEAAGRVLRAGLAHGLLFGVAIIVWSLLGERFYTFMGQTPELARGAAGVSLAFACGIPGILAFTAFSLFLEATGRPKASMVVMLFANVANFGLNGVVVLGWGGFMEPAGAQGAVAVSSALRTLAAVMLGIYVVIIAMDHDVHDILAPPRRWISEMLRLGGETGRTIRRLGLPMGIAQGVESAAFATVVFLAGLLGPDALAAYQIAMALMSLVFMMAIGMAGATSIRVGRAIGRANAGNVVRAGWSGVGIGVVLTVPASILFWTAPEAVAGVFTQQPEVLAHAVDAVWFIGWIIAADATMAISMGALRGAGDVWVPTGLQVAAFWLAGVPTAWVLALHLDIGPVGLLAGTGTGILVSIILMLRRWMRVSGHFARALPAAV